jgi:hypothetical protein
MKKMESRRGVGRRAQAAASTRSPGLLNRRRPGSAITVAAELRPACGNRDASHTQRGGGVRFGVGVVALGRRAALQAGGLAAAARTIRCDCPVRRPRRVASGEVWRALLRSGFGCVTGTGFGSGSATLGTEAAARALDRPIHAANFKSNAGIGSPDSCNAQPEPSGCTAQCRI